METIYEKNLSYLNRLFPHVYKVVNAYKKNSRELEISLVETKNCRPNLKVSLNGNSFFLHSNYNPENEANILANSLAVENKDTIVIMGFGMGYHIDKFIQQFPKKNKLIIEPNIEIFTFMLQHQDITPILTAKNVQIIVTSSIEQISHELIVLYQLGHISLLEFTALPAYLRMEQPLWDEVKVNFTKFMRTYTVNARTIQLFKNTWLLNFFSNLKFLSESADLIDFAGKFKSVPAIIVSAGPSLNKNIELLKELGDKALIIAAGSAISILRREGIKPHIMLAIDGGPAMSEFYSDFEWDDILFAYVLNLHYKSLEYYQGPKIYIKTCSEMQVDWFERSANHITPAISSGGSCANICLDFVKNLGCNPTIFIGQDLAYTNMQTHAEGRTGKRNVDNSTMDFAKLIKAKDINGEDIYTVDIFMTMANCFENYIKANAKENIFINATEGGLDIKGTKVMTLKEAMSIYCTESINIKTRISELYQQSSAINKNLNHEVVKFVKKILKNTKILSNLSQKRLNHIEKMLKNIKTNNLNEVSQQKSKLLDLTKKIEKNELFQGIIEAACREILLIVKNNSEAEAEKVIAIKDKLEILYSGLKRQFEEVEEKNKVIEYSAKQAQKQITDEEWANE